MSKRYRGSNKTSNIVKYPILVDESETGHSIKYKFFRLFKEETVDKKREYEISATTKKTEYEYFTYWVWFNTFKVLKKYSIDSYEYAKKDNEDIEVAAK